MKQMLLLIFILTLMPFVYQVHPVSALDLSKASVRLNSAGPNASPGNILIQIQPTTIATENQLIIDIGSAWSISSNSSNYQVTTSDLPGGITPWPGIDTATDVTGNTITFPSGDLTIGNTYGFFLTGGIPTNPEYGYDDTFQWTLRTLNSGVAIDESTIPTNLSPQSSNITINAQVAEPGTYIDLDISDNVITKYVSRGDFVTYTLTYSNTHVNTMDLTLEFSWEEGIIQGDDNQTVTVAHFVGASNAYNDTPPVVDLVENTVTWSIQDFPGEVVDQVAQVQLIIVDAYKGSRVVDFDTNLVGLVPDNVTPTSNRIQYKYVPIEAGPGPGNVVEYDCNQECYDNNQCASDFCHPVFKRCRNPGNPESNVCKLETSVDTPPIHMTIPQLVALTDTTAQINTSTTKPTGLTLWLGPTPTSMVPYQITENETDHRFYLSQLDPETRYFFQIINKDEFLESSIFTFTTASEPPTFVWNQNASLISSHQLPVWHGQQPQEWIYAATTTPLTVTVAYEPAEMVNQAEVLLMPRDPAVDSISGVTAARLFEVVPGVFSGIVYAPESLASYDLSLQTTDFYGSIQTDHLTNLQTSPPLQLIDATEQTPLGFAQVYLERFNPRLEQFQRMENIAELSTDERGLLYQALPAGEYQVVVDTPGFATKVVPFMLASDAQNHFPSIQVERDTRFVGRARFIVDRVYTNTQLLITTTRRIMSQSLTMMMISYLAMALLVISSTIVISYKTKVDVIRLPLYVIHSLVRLIVPKKLSDTYEGKVVDRTGKSLSGVTIHFYNPQLEETEHTKTNMAGRFSKQHIPEGTEVMFTKPGFAPHRSEVLYGHPKTIRLHKAHSFWWGGLQVIHSFVMTTLEMFYELILLLSLIGLVISTLLLGYQATLLYVVISFINVSAFVLYKARKIIRV